MTFACGAEWTTNISDEDGDGAADHFCFRPAGHDGFHLCADHFACSPVWDAAAWSAEEGRT